MKPILFKGRIYLVAAPRLRNGGSSLTCDAYNTATKRDHRNNKRTYPTRPVTGVLTLDALARLYLEGKPW